MGCTDKSVLGEEKNPTSPVFMHSVVSYRVAGRYNCIHALIPSFQHQQPTQPFAKYFLSWRKETSKIWGSWKWVWFLSCVYVCVFHWDTMKWRLYIISNICVANEIVVMFCLAEENKGSLSLFYIFLIFLVVASAMFLFKE